MTSPARAGPTDLKMRSPNVSVTAINVVQTDPNPSFHSGDDVTGDSVTTSTGNVNGDQVQNGTSDQPDPVELVPQRNGVVDNSEEDAEVARIDFQSVHLRQKTKGSGKMNDAPRPMSWEGELSDNGDRDDMCVDEDDERNDSGGDLQLPENLSINSHSSNNIVSPSKQHIFPHHPPLCSKDDSSIVRLKHQAAAAAALMQQQGSTYSLHSTPSNSPLLSQRHTIPFAKELVAAAQQHKEYIHKNLAGVPPTPSPDSAVHSAPYSVFSSPAQSPLLSQRHNAGNSVSLTPNLSRNNSDASHSSCCSYSSVSAVSSVSPTQQFSPTHSPIQGRHVTSHHGSPLHHNVLYRSIHDPTSSDPSSPYPSTPHDPANFLDVSEDPLSPSSSSDDKSAIAASLHTSVAAQPGISRQQLINSPCPICGDKISGFHYGIFSCESCKGFFKRTVQNRKNYVCLRGGVCPVTVATRKKCPACRFEKCLQCGMKLEAIREDRTRGGRSTYQCSYSLPPHLGPAHSAAELRGASSASDLRMMSISSAEAVLGHLGHGSGRGGISAAASLGSVKLEPGEGGGAYSFGPYGGGAKRTLAALRHHGVPPLLQEIMDVEHLWHYNELELNRLHSEGTLGTAGKDGGVHSLQTHPLLAGTALAGSNIDTNPDFVANLCNIADHRLYKIVKWCKSLPLFKNISIDDQICLLINSWCELLLFSCCFRSMSTPGEIRVSLGKSITLAKARDTGMQACIERMLNFTEQLRRLRVDRYEYVAMKVIVLLTSDTSELREAEKVRVSQEKALKALQDYTLSHYPESPAKFGELLLRIPELQRTCQVGKEMLTIKSKDSEGPSFNLLMELLRGDH